MKTHKASRDLGKAICGMDLVWLSTYWFEVDCKRCKSQDMQKIEKGLGKYIDRSLENTFKSKGEKTPSFMPRSKKKCGKARQTQLYRLD